MKPIAITVHNDLRIDRPSEAVTVGVPFPVGAIKDLKTLHVSDAKGNPRPSQARAQSTWADGSVRWALLYFTGDLRGNGATTFRLDAKEKSGNGSKAATVDHVLKVDKGETRLSVNTGVLRFDIDAANFRGFENVFIQTRGGDGWVRGAERTQDGSLYLKDKDGKLYSAMWSKAGHFSLVDNGPLVVTARVEGAIADPQGNGLVEYDLWLQAWAGMDTVRAWLTVRNPRPTSRRVLGQWPQGLAGSVYFKELGWKLAPVAEGVPYVTLHGGAEPRAPQTQGYTTEHGRVGEVYRGPFTQSAKLVQDSSGGENWYHRTHVNHEWRIPLKYRGFKASVDGVEVRQGDRADAWVALEDARIGIAVGVRHFWQNFPKAVRALKNADGRVEIAAALWPEEFSDIHELQGGEQKTHELAFHFFRGDNHNGFPIPFSRWPETQATMARLLNPPTAFVEGRQYVESGAFDHLALYDDKRSSDYEKAAHGGVGDPVRNLFLCREEVDEYGWRNFGDVWADNEVGGRILSHYNLEYDMGYAMLLQCVRAAHTKPGFALKWWDLATAALRHESDIDIYHTTQDGHNGGVYGGGKFTHSDHGFEPGRSTHRANDEDGIHGDLTWEWGAKGGGSRGGGPESGHFGSRGMFIYGMMSGYQPALKVAVEIADLVHRKVTTDNFAQHYFDRSSGHNLQCLIEAHLITGDRKYLDSGRIVIDRSHADRWPWSQGKGGMTCWSGSIFLKEVARYIELQEAEGRKPDERAVTCMLESVEAFNRMAWNEDDGRFWHAINGDGSTHRYGAEYWWDLKTLEMVAWAARWQSDAAKRKLWLARAKKNFEIACKLLVGGRKTPVYHTAKGSTVTGGNGPGYLALERELGSAARAGARAKSASK